MSLTPIVSTVSIILGVTPGLHYALVRTNRSGRQESAGPQVGRAVISGVLLTTGTLAILELAHRVGHGTVIGIGDLLVDEAYPPSSLRVTTWSVLSFLAISLTLSALAAAVLDHVDTASRTFDGRAYTRAQKSLTKMLTPDMDIEVKLASGKTYRGLFGGHSNELDLKESQLVLDGPIFHLDDLGDPLPIDPVHWHRLIIPKVAISSILVRHAADSWYISTPPQTPIPRGPSRHSRSQNSAIDHLMSFAQHCYERRHDPYLLATALASELFVLGSVALVGRWIM